MFQVNDYVVYKNEVCSIKEIKKNFFKGKDYYVLSPSLDSSLTINIPIDNSSLKPIMTKEEANLLIRSFTSINPIESNDKMIENEYKLLLKTEKKEDLVKIIKTTYLRNDERLKTGKRIGERDEVYFQKAEKLLYSELALSLGMSYEETKKYIFDVVNSTN